MPVIDLMVERIWPEAKRIILSWTDQATEIFILDLPFRDMARVLDVILTMTRDTAILRLDGRNLDVEVPLDEISLGDLLRRSHKTTVHSVRGRVPGDANCYFYLWLDAEQRALEVEMVFWNDLTFPAGRSVDEHKQVLGHYLRIAHRIRGNNHQSKCILSAEYNSEPRELLSSEEVIIW